ncbi:MAG: response regulator [Clostridia bacterium]|nr:response regulator [Clostridia bacterium]
MDKLLIVDDDYLVREGLRVAIDWQSIGLEVAGTAENGAIGLEKARELKPDLIIADVRMPVMDGLQMAKTLFDEKADLAIIAYSGYKDFENARRALDSGVAGFLLKPIESDELLKRVSEVMQKLHEKRANNRMIGQFISSLPIVRQQQFEILLKDEAKSNSAAEQLALLGVCLPKAGTLIYIYTDNPYVKTFINKAEEVLSAHCNASEVFSDRAVILTSAELGFVREEITKLLDSSLKETDARFSVAAASFDGDIPAAYSKAKELGKNTLFTVINAVVTENKNGHLKKVVRDALQIIERDYNKKLSVKSVADMLYTSESHLMHEFKAQVGKTFNECLTDFRILKAQEMLLKGDMRIGEVAYAVGYNDVKYFGQVFRDYLGCTPSEWLDKKRQ